MHEIERAQREIAAIIADIERMQREAGRPEWMFQAEDREAFEIVRRIERKLKRQPAEAEGGA